MKAILLTVSQLAFEFAQSRDTIRKRLADRGVEPVEKRGGRPVYSLRAAIPALTGDDAKPFERKAVAQSVLLEMKIRQESGELIPRFDVEQEQARILRNVALFADTLPDVIERDCGLAPEAIARVERAVDELREALYRRLAGANGASEGAHV